MKTNTLVFLLLLLGSLVFATTLPHRQDNDLFFGGNLAVATKGDTIAYSYYSDQMLMLRFSFDAGQNWHEVSRNDGSQESQPSIFIADDGIYIVTKMGTFKYAFESNHFSTLFWDSEPDGDKPHLAVLGNRVYYFYTSKHYPIQLQNDFSYNGWENPCLKPINYFCDSMKNMNGTFAYYRGTSEIYGILAANSDIAIKQIGGGNNSGWPLFWGPVLCAGHIRAIPNYYSVNEVFRGGLYQETRTIGYPDNIQRTDFDHQLGGANKIILIEMNGDTFSGWEGTLGPERRVRKTVYNNYPPGADSLYSNNYTVRDTVWTVLQSFDPVGKHILVDGDLWIRGNFSGVQSWYATGDIKLIGEITLSNTTPGQYPVTSPLDMVNLISRGNVLVGYGYKHPATQERHHCFVAPNTQPMYIYANIYAIGQDLPNPFKAKGSFTFEYQHPHPSTPAIAVNLGDEIVVFDNIDIHRRHYPPTAANPWPSPALGQQQLDLPYYNPLWPEARPYLERGILHIYGNIYQRRRGFLHRSNNDQEYPSNAGQWDIEIDKCGYPTDPVNIQDPVFGNQIGLMSMNYPGTTGEGVGYKFTFFKDSRYTELCLRDECYDSIFASGLRVESAEISGIYTETPISLAATQNNEITLSKSVSLRDSCFVYSSNASMLYLPASAPAKDLSDLVQAEGIILNAEIDPDGIIWVLQTKVADNLRYLKLSNINPVAELVLDSQVFPAEYIPKPAAICISEGGRKFFGFYEEGFLEIKELVAGSGYQNLASIDVSDYNTDYSTMSLRVSRENKLHIWFWENTSQDPVWGTGNLHYYSMELPVANEDIIVPALVESSLKAYPNPAKDKMNLSLKLPRHQVHELEIYNIRGQKVHSIRQLASEGKSEYEYQWDIKNQELPSGLYILRLKIDGKKVLQKKISVF